MSRARFSLLKGRGREYVVAAMAAVAIASLAVFGVWVFRGERSMEATSLWQLILSDRATVGFVRAALVFLSLYVIVSLVALAFAGRWVRSLGKGGIEVEAVKNAEQEAARLIDRVRLLEERHEAVLRLLRMRSDG